MQFIISHEGDPIGQAGIARIMKIKTAAKEAIRGTPLEDPRSTWAVPRRCSRTSDGSTYDDEVAGISALCLIFIIILIVPAASSRPPSSSAP